MMLSTSIWFGLRQGGLEVKSLKNFVEKAAQLSRESGSSLDREHRKEADPFPRSLTQLSEAGKAKFFSEIEEVFTKQSPGSLNRQNLRRKLIELNKRGESGTQAIIEQLNKTPSSDAEVEPRLAMIDYLAYRARFDSKALDGLERLASQAIEAGVPLRYQATLMADKAELLGSLAAVDWGRASVILSGEENNLLKQLMASESYHGLLKGGASKDYALDSVKIIIPDFQL
jgi:hypothetical protein